MASSSVYNGLHRVKKCEKKVVTEDSTWTAADIKTTFCNYTLHQKGICWNWIILQEKDSCFTLNQLCLDYLPSHLQQLLSPRQPLSQTCQICQTLTSLMCQPFPISFFCFPKLKILHKHYRLLMKMTNYLLIWMSVTYITTKEQITEFNIVCIFYFTSSEHQNSSVKKACLPLHLIAWAKKQ